MWRTIPTTSWDFRIYPWYNCMSIIITWLWNDIQLWEDAKLWWDDWEKGTGYNERTPIITNWN